MPKSHFGSSSPYQWRDAVTSKLVARRQLLQLSLNWACSIGALQYAGELWDRITQIDRRIVWHSALPSEWLADLFNQAREYPRWRKTR